MPTFDKVDNEQMNYGIILNDIDESVSFPVDLGSWTIEKATIDEIDEFRQTIWNYKAASSMQAPFQEMKISKTPSGASYKHITDKSKWRYTVLKPKEGSTLSGSNLSEACRISDCDIWVETFCITNREKERKVGGRVMPCVRFLMTFELYNKPIIPDLEHLRQVILLREHFEDEKFPAIVRAIEMFRQQDTHGNTHLKHLGYFAIIESLLSHAPKPNDSADSISRQLKRNLKLLHNRMNPSYNLQIEDFNGAKPDTVISKLYGYRSSIAHGNTSDSDLKWLYENRPNNTGNKSDKHYWNKWIGKYLRTIVQRVLVHALREPQLTIDLK